MHCHAIKFASRSFLFLSLLAGAACSSDDAANPGGADADVGAPDAAVGSTDWQTIIAGDWEVPAGDEIYRCVRLTVSEDMYITGFKSVGPLGTHHTVLTVGDPSGPDGSTPCQAGTNNSSVMFGSGVGDVEYHFPTGVGVKVPAGQQMLLNLHLFNVSDSVLTGNSGSQAIMVAASEIENEAEAVLMGSTFGLVIPEGNTTQIGNCTMEKDLTLLTVSPHMHQLGTHMKVEAIRADGNVVLHDQPYNFYDQSLYVLEALSMKQGDKIEVACSYNNTSGGEVKFGDSSKQEMCFATMYRYPKQVATQFSFICDDNIPF